MELNKLSTLATSLILSGCCLFEPKPEPFDVNIPIGILEECEYLSSDIDFKTFNDVLNRKIEETKAYYECADKHLYLIKVIGKLEDVKIIRVPTPESKGSSN